MNKQEKKKERALAVGVVRIIFTVIFFVALILLIYENSCPAGQLTLDYEVGGDRSRSISLLEPKYRVSTPVEANGQVGQILISNPVYFNVHTVLPFEKAKIEVVYQNPKEYQFKVGGLVNEELWQFDFKKIVPEQIGSGWLVGQAEFDLSGYYRNHNQYRFILSVPYVELDQASDGLMISEIRVQLEKEPLTFKTFLTKIFNKIKRRLGHYGNYQAV